MKEEGIVNKVAGSKLVLFDLEEYYPAGNRILLDISPWLEKGILLREKDFRERLSTQDWSLYQNAYVALHCTTETILPSWTYLLVTSKLHGIAKKVVVGDHLLLETVLYTDILATLDLLPFTNRPVIIKGCSSKKIPSSAYSLLVEKIQSVASSIRFGEACSSVPIFRKNGNK